MANSAGIFSEIQQYLFSYEHADRCSEDIIEKHCFVYGSIFSTLDLITAKLRIKSGEAKDEDYDVLEEALDTLRDLWKRAATLNHTPKLHSVLTHSLKQMRLYGGIGDLLEDDVEKMHQIAGRFESRVSRIKGANSRAVAQAKMEAVSINNNVTKHVETSQYLSKRKFEKKDIASDENLPLIKKIKLQKDQRNQQRVVTIKKLKGCSLPTIETAYERIKKEYVNNEKQVPENLGEQPNA
jgi:hypothetical protein